MQEVSRGRVIGTKDGKTHSSIIEAKRINSEIF